MTLIGLDIGGTKIRGVAVNTSGSVLADLTRPTQPGPEGVTAAATSLARDLLHVAALPARQLRAVGIGVPGQVDPATGVVRTSVNLAIEECDLGPRLRAALGVPVMLDNDVKAAALGAAEFLDRPDVTLVNIGTGVASATVLEGRLLRGSANVAGEIGHIPVDPAGPWCRCGQRGCIEALAGGRQVAERLAVHQPKVSLPTLVSAAAAGHPAAVDELARVSSAIATAVQVTVLAHGSRCIALTGGVVHAGVGLVEAVRETLEQRGAQSAFLASLALPGRVILVPATAPIAVLGAVQLAAEAIAD